MQYGYWLPEFDSRGRLSLRVARRNLLQGGRLRRLLAAADIVAL
jgi:hypothetical protein